MPRNDRNKKQPASPSLDDDGNTDAASVVSSESEAKTITLDDVGSDGMNDQVDTSSSNDLIEDKLKDAIENATDSSAKTREAALTTLNLGFERRLLFDFIIDRQVSLGDIIERSLKRGKSCEQVLAARLGALLFIQLGPDCEDLYKQIRPVLLYCFSDKSTASLARSASAETLGVGSFIANEEAEEFAEVLQKLNKTFATSYLKGDKTSPQLNQEAYSLNAQSLRAWSLLMSVASDHIALDEINTHMRKLPELLEANDVELRIAAGETIALLNEITRDLRVDRAKLPDMDVLCTRLRELSTESSKHRAKKDKKQQRSIFRDVLHSVEDDDGVFQRIRFGKETLDLFTWRRKHQYDALCNILRTGMNHHLRKNTLVRQIFDLGEPLVDDIVPRGAKMTDKLQRQVILKAVEKETKLGREKSRNNKRLENENFDDHG